MTARDDVTLPRSRSGGHARARTDRAGDRPGSRPASRRGSHRGGRRVAGRAEPDRPSSRRASEPARPAPASRGRSRGRRIARRPHLPLWQELGLLVVVAVVLAVVVKTFFVQAFYIPSGSMEPTFEVQDRVLVQKVSYWAGDVDRGDVVVFDDPGGWLDAAQERRADGPLQRGLEAVGLFPTGGHLIKRVIGVGGDRVTCCGDDGRLRVNGVPLQEPYLADQVSTAEQTFDVRVPEGYLWVMGDNRGDSADSRAHLGDPGGGFLPLDDVTGKAWLTVWPTSRFGPVGSAGSTFDDVQARAEDAGATS